MSDKRRPAISHRTLVLLLVLVLIAICGIGLYTILARTSPSRRLERSSTAPLVGTWKGDEVGNVLNLRPDGTARVRASSGETIGYFEWTLNKSNELVIYQYPSKNRAWMTRALSPIIGLPPTSRDKVIEISPTRFKLRSSHNGNVFTFTRTEDGELETAP